jgi:hypothetical protein
MASTQFDRILRELAAGEVEAVLVGMVAAVLHGAPWSTRDVDIVHNRAPDNVARLVEVLRRLHATFRHDPRKLQPDGKAQR